MRHLSRPPRYGGGDVVFGRAKRNRFDPLPQAAAAAPIAAAASDPPAAAGADGGDGDDVRDDVAAAATAQEAQALGIRRFRS